MFLLHEVLKISRKSTTPRPVSPRGTVCVHFTLTLFVPKRVKNQNKLTNLNSKLKLNKIQSSKLLQVYSLSKSIKTTSKEQKTIRTI